MLLNNTRKNINLAFFAWKCAMRKIIKIKKYSRDNNS